MKHVKSISVTPRQASQDIGIGTILQVVASIVGVIANALVVKEGGTPTSGS